MENLLRDRWLRALIIFTITITICGFVFGGSTQKQGSCRTDMHSEQALLRNSELDRELKVHFLNVGDAESILIQQGSKTMLIDAGNDKDDLTIREYLEKQGITRIDFLIGTHIHEDHIGALDYLIRKFDIGKIYLPKCEHTNKYFEDVKAALKEKGLEASTPVSGEIITLGGAVCTILAPISMGYEAINNYSIVIKLQYGKNSFLFTGDAEKASEMEMLRRGYDLTADVLKLGHHGSITSTSNEFLDRVNPKYAVICTDYANKYKHPHNSVMKRLKSRMIKVYRTDENGTIIATSDGEKIKFNVKPGSYKGK